MTHTAGASTSNPTDERIVMVGAAIPDDVMDMLMEVDPTPQIQTHKLSWAMVRGIESTGRTLDLISTLAMSDFPKARRVCIGYRKWDRGNGSDNRIVPFINLLGFKQLSRFIGCLFFLIRWAFANRKRNRKIFLYGLISSHLLAALCVRFLFGIKTTVLITDLPGLAISAEPWWRRLLRPLDNGFIHRSVKAMDGLVVLTRQIAEDYAPGIPFIVMEGMVSVESESLALKHPEPANNADPSFTILYAGGLNSAYGIPLLLDAFDRLADDAFRLHLLGAGNMVDDIRRRAQNNPRIVYDGLVPPVEAFRKSREATVLINPRPTNASFASYSFPSKLLEYMATGRPVVATRLPGIPAEYEPYILWIDEETPEALAALLQRIREMPRDQLDDFGQKAQEFVLREKNCRAQCSRIVDFLDRAT